MHTLVVAELHRDEFKDKVMAFYILKVKGQFHWETLILIFNTITQNGRGDSDHSSHVGRYE